MDARAIVELVAGFEDRTLPPARWNHAAHLTVAAYYVHRFGRADATRRMRDGIQRFNAAAGHPTGYHETVTLAWLALVARFLASRPAEEPFTASAAHLVAQYADKALLLAHYRRETLLSPQARAGWVPPDVAPID